MIVYPYTNSRNSQKITLKTVRAFINEYWFRSALLFFALNILFNKDLSIHVNMNGTGAESELQNSVESAPAKSSSLPISYNADDLVDESKWKNEAPKAMAMGVGMIAKPKKKKPATPKKWSAKDFNNLSFVLHPTYANRKGVPDFIVEQKLDICHKYVERYAKVAIAEMEKYDIPASITLAQGLLESDAGNSRLSKESSNHFGIKCKAKCLDCTCRNYRDDDIYDMFRVFPSVWESYREHSKLLSNSRYGHLKKHGTKDYKSWAFGLKKAGYATDKRYAEKLIQIIEELDLYQFDK